MYQNLTVEAYVNNMLNNSVLLPMYYCSKAKNESTPENSTVSCHNWANASYVDFVCPNVADCMNISTTELRMANNTMADLAVSLLGENSNASVCAAAQTWEQCNAHCAVNCTY